MLKHKLKAFRKQAHNSVDTCPDALHAPNSVWFRVIYLTTSEHLMQYLYNVLLLISPPQFSCSDNGLSEIGTWCNRPLYKRHFARSQIL